jgi:hypothetical protein
MAMPRAPITPRTPKGIVQDTQGVVEARPDVGEFSQGARRGTEKQVIAAETRAAQVQAVRGALSNIKKDTYRKAVEDIIEAGGPGGTKGIIDAAAKKHNIPRSTMFRTWEKFKKDVKKLSKQRTDPSATSVMLRDMGFIGDDDLLKTASRELSADSLSVFRTGLNPKGGR